MNNHLSSRPNRRSFMIMASSAGALAGLNPSLGFAADNTLSSIRWSGGALGAAGTIELHHADTEYAKSVLLQCQNEIERLENLFSIYRANSTISRLNKNGFLDDPDIHFLELLSAAQSFSVKTAGLFDITIQPLWQFYSSFYMDEGNRSRKPTKSELAPILDRIGYQKLHLTNNRIEFAAPGMAITLNGVAQGFITDRIKSMLLDAGFKHVLLSLGEIAAIGPKPSGGPWHIALDNGQISNKTKPTVISLTNQAVATSGTSASPFPGGTGANHLLNPVTGEFSNLEGTVSVVAPNATTADLYSTTLSIMPKKHRQYFVDTHSSEIKAVYYSSRQEGENWLA